MMVPMPDGNADGERPRAAESAAREPVANEWDTSPLFESPAGPDNVADGIVAAINSVVGGARALGRRVAALWARR